MIAVLKREIKSYFITINGYILVFFMLAIVGVYTAIVNLRNGYASFESTIYSVRFVYLVFVPILTMKLFAEERRQKSEQLLFSLPVSMTKIVLGKYLAAVSVLAIPCAVMCAYPLILSQYGDVNLKIAYSAIAGYFLLGAALVSMGVYMSSLSDNQVASAAACFGLLILLFIMTGISESLSTEAYTSFVGFCIFAAILSVVVYFVTSSVYLTAAALGLSEAVLIITYFFNSSWFEGKLLALLNVFAVFDKTTIFISGIFDVTVVIYYLSVTFLFVLFTVMSLENRRSR